MEPAATVSGLLEPTFFSAKLLVKPLAEKVTVSPINTPASVALPAFNGAVVVPSYTLVVAPTPVSVRGAGVMLPVTPVTPCSV